MPPTYLKPLLAILGVKLLELVVVATGLASERSDVRDQHDLALGRRERVLGSRGLLSRFFWGHLSTGAKGGLEGAGGWREKERERISDRPATR